MVMKMANMEKLEKFSTRNVFTTPSIREEFCDSMGEIQKNLYKHFINESDLCEEDLEMNEQAINDKCGRVLSMFKTSKGKIYIITSGLEYMDNDPTDINDINYYNTVVMFANEY